MRMVDAVTCTSPVLQQAKLLLPLTELPLPTTALKISYSRLLPLSTAAVHQYRALFKYVKVLIIDEISMIYAELLSQIDSRLKQITGDFKTNFGGLDVILIGDLRQLPPV